MFWESPTCLLARAKCFFLIFFFKQWLFFLSLFHKNPVLWSVRLKVVLWTDIPTPLRSFAAPSGLSLVSLLPLWLMPSLPGLWVWWAALSWQVCCGATFFPFFNNGFNGAQWDVQSFYFFITQPWFVLLHNFVPDLFGELLGLHSAACLLVPLA